jgi:hypothetical protein
MGKRKEFWLHPFLREEDPVLLIVNWEKALKDSYVEDTVSLPHFGE